MRWTNVKLIFGREVRDQLRDRRTLFMILVLPILLYPALGIGLVQMTVFFTQQPRRVAVVGAEYLPESPPLVENGYFARQWFVDEEQVRQLEVVRDVTSPQAVQRGEVQVMVLFAPDTREKLARGVPIEPVVIRNTADEKSLYTYVRVMEILSQWQNEIARQWLASRDLPPEFLNPVQAQAEDVAIEESKSANVWAKLFPFLLVIMSLTGAFYPAVDICAGEKERGTMETLLISPAARSEIVLGKYFTIMAFSVATALLNLLSMGVTGWQMAALTGSATAGVGEGAALLRPPGLLAAVWILVLLVPLSAFFSALCLSLAAFARSSKEGQYYLMPLYLITLPLTVLTVAPGVELSPFYSVVPVTGVALLLKALLLMQYDVARVYFLPVLLPTILYSLLALRWAIDQFNREDVLFREAERFELRLWVRHLLRDKEDTPSAGEAVFCFVLMILLMWFSLPFFAGRSLDLFTPRDLVQVMAIPQLAFVAAPALLMSVMLTRRPRITLRLHWPRWSMLPLSVLLALSCHPLVAELGRWVQHLLPVAPEVSEKVQQLLSPRIGLGLQLFVIAFLPAICEELAFRGFILSGLFRGHRAWSAVLVSAFLFGVFHLFLQQMFTAIVLGVVLGLIAVHSRSLLPCSLFHFTNNALTVLMVRALADGAEAHPWLGVLLRSDGELVYRVPVLLAALLVAGGLLTWLVVATRRRPAPGGPEPAEDAAPRESLVHSGV